MTLSINFDDNSQFVQKKKTLTGNMSTGDRYAVLNEDGSTTVHYANGKTETIPPVFKGAAQQQAQKVDLSSNMEVGDKYAVLNDDGSTTIYYANGKTETIPADDVSSDEVQEKEPVTNSDEVSKPQSDNSERLENVKKFTPYLDKFAIKLGEIISNRNNYSPGDFVQKRDEFIKNEAIQEMLNKCLGKPGKGLAQTGRIKTENGTIIALTARNDIHTGQYYWDVMSSSTKKE